MKGGGGHAMKGGVKPFNTNTARRGDPSNHQDDPTLVFSGSSPTRESKDNSKCGCSQHNATQISSAYFPKRGLHCSDFPRCFAFILWFQAAYSRSDSKCFCHRTTGVASSRSNLKFFIS